MFDEEARDYYKILDIQPNASPSDIRQAYMRAKSAYAKDSSAIYSLFDINETREYLDKIEEAYLILSNPDRRKEYDKTHGFLKSSDRTDQFNTKKPQQKNVFSFGGSSVPQKANPDPAEEAAAAVFNEKPSGESKNASVPATASSEFSGLKNISEVRARLDTSQYTTPRTLDQAQQGMGPMVESYSPKTLEGRIGPVRRVDLIKSTPDPELEATIQNEAEFRGEFLKNVRQRRQISVEALSEFTKISKTYINCIEAEEFESLPAAPYIRGFVIQIAKALKVPHDKAATGYMANYNKILVKP